MSVDYRFEMRALVPSGGWSQWGSMSDALLSRVMVDAGLGAEDRLRVRGQLQRGETWSNMKGIQVRGIPMVVRDGV